MGTRCMIAIENNDGTVEAVYCHHDGYPEHAGKMLLTHYNNRVIIEQLIALGDLSSLSKKIAADDEHSYENPARDVCVFYHRDRDEEWKTVNPHQFRSIAEFLADLGGHDDTEYQYVYEKNNFWTVYKKPYCEPVQERRLLSDTFPSIGLTVSHIASVLTGVDK